MTETSVQALADPDVNVDQEIFTCVDPQGPRSFFLYAGAGSGKTRSLVNTLSAIRERHGRWLWLRGKRVAVITYTNAAADEIKSRAKSDPLFEVSTIHSFIWTLIAGYNYDIREWLRVDLAEDIAELEAAQLKGRAGSKAAEQRARDIINKTERLANLDRIRVFTYNPNGDNREREALSHADVISMGSEFITSKSALRGILATRYPTILIDESQDTNKLLVDALLGFEEEFRGRVCVGFIGDTMQRIYADGKANLPEAIPESWATPSKVMNHRSPERIVRLINKIRADADDQRQQNRPDKSGGIVRLILASSKVESKDAIEAQARLRMAEISQDPFWTDQEHVKTLGLEHHMLASRMGFSDLFTPLYGVKRFRTGLLSGNLPGMRLFTADVLPVIEAKRNSDAFLLTSILRKRSPLLQARALKLAGEEQVQNIARAREGIERLYSLWDNGADPKCLEVLRVIAETGLFEIPESLRPYADVDDDIQLLNEIMKELNLEIGPKAESDDEEDDEVNAQFAAWEKALDAPMSQAAKYADYVSGNSSFDTHQGVKGLQFPRVMVVVDDQEARGFMFRFDKLLGAEDLSSGDLSRQEAGEETVVDRTRRLLYVTASRAEESLVIMVYTADPARVKTSVIQAGWFDEEEVEFIA